MWKSPSAKKGVLLKNATDERLKDGQLYTVAFLPKGASIPKPTSASKIAAFLISNPGGLAPADVAQPTSSTLKVTPGTTKTTSAKSGSTTKSKGSTKTTG